MPELAPFHRYRPEGLGFLGGPLSWGRNPRLPYVALVLPWLRAEAAIIGLELRPTTEEGRRIHLGRAYLPIFGYAVMSFVVKALSVPPF